MATSMKASSVSAMLLAAVVMVSTSMAVGLGAGGVVGGGGGGGDGGIRCEDVAIEQCAFAVSSTGNRCVLEKSLATDATIRYHCQTSGVMAEEVREWIEEEECVKGCGLNRMWVGMSTDALMWDDRFKTSLCSEDCLSKCHNMVSLFSGMAAGEGISLHALCSSHRNRARRLSALYKISTSSSSSSSVESPALAPVDPFPHIAAAATTLTPEASPAPALVPDTPMEA